MTEASEKRLYDLLSLLFSISRQANSEITQVLEEFALTVPLADVLWILDPSLPPPAMRAVADRLHCDPSSLTFLVDRLSQHGLVERKPDPGNRRIKRLVLTPYGGEVRRRLIEAMIARTSLARLSTSDQESLIALLTKASSVISVEER